ncbi:MAG: metallophosphoesterase [Nanoarchaeota archaeon]|nr:metallophosphoesterase [Nanoarchaeota archaeon]
MEIHPKIEIVDLALKYKDILILGDLQLGYEDYLNKNGIMVPRFQTEDTLNKIRGILDNVNVKIIVFNGDVKHQFSGISPQEWDSVEMLIEELIEKYKIVIVKGNHDNLLEPILKKYKGKIELVNSYKVDNITIVHGDKIIPNPSEIIIIGHEHPAIGFKEKPNEKYKCFLKGKWNKHILIVMPSFNMLTIGSDVSKEKILSPYLKTNLEDYNVYVVEDKTYCFGKLKNIL